MEKEKKSIIKEALTDYKEIMEAAEINAKKKLAEQFPENFNKLLSEEINKNKNIKESYKKIEDDNEESDNTDENNSNKESDMKKEVKETVKVTDTVGKGKPFGEKKVEEDVKITEKGVKVTNTVGKADPFKEKPKGVAKVEEDVKITDTVGKSDPFTEKGKKTKIEEEREKSFTADVEGDTPNIEKGTTKKGIAFVDNVKPTSNIKEEFDISELNTENAGAAIDGAEDEDDFITIDEIEDEISKMEGLGEELQDMQGLPRPELQKRGEQTGQAGDAFTKLVSMRNELDEMIKAMGGVQETQDEAMNLQPDEMSPSEYSSAQMDEEMEEEGTEITDADIDAVLGTNAQKGVEEEIEEAHGVSHSAGTINPSKLPSKEYLSTGEASRRRFSKFDESEKKIQGLIEENKKLTKKLNEVKKVKDTSTALVENYKSALEKYRNQLKEMAIFNTNLANVNNLLVNESLALTQDDKIKIINDFKKVNSISESQKVYKSILSEMKDSKKTISESIENKVSASIQQSSKQKLDEVVEKTAYENNEHINKMKNLIYYGENRGKKNNS
jgi:hypothetical protein